MPYVPPKSLQFKQEEVPALFKARTHLEKSEGVAEPHLKYLELWKGFEALYRDMAKPTGRMLQNRGAGRDAAELDMIGALLTTLSRPRVEQLLAHDRIPLLNATLARKRMKSLLADNEFLAENGMTDAAYQVARRDLQFNLKSNYIKAAEGLARLLFIVRGACDPQVRKKENLVSETEILGHAYEVLRFAIWTLSEQMGEAHATFMGVGERQKSALEMMQKGRKA